MLAKGLLCKCQYRGLQTSDLKDEHKIIQRLKLVCLGFLWFFDFMLTLNPVTCYVGLNLNDGFLFVCITAQITTLLLVRNNYPFKDLSKIVGLTSALVNVVRTLNLVSLIEMQGDMFLLHFCITLIVLSFNFLMVKKLSFLIYL